jgi:hypothetical protein
MVTPTEILFRVRTTNDGLSFLGSMAPSSTFDQHREHSDVLQIVYKVPNDVAEFLARANYVRSWSVRPSL